MLTCPKCERNANVVCGSKDCICHELPEGEEGLIYRPTFLGIVIPNNLHSFLWKAFFKVSKDPYKLGLDELEECPYCGFRASFSFWEDREMEQSFPNGFFGELEKMTNQIKEKQNDY